LILDLSLQLIRPAVRKERLRLGDFLAMIWLVKAFFRFILPLEVFLNRFAAALDVLILGTFTPCSETLSQS